MKMNAWTGKGVRLLQDVHLRSDVILKRGSQFRVEGHWRGSLTLIDRETGRTMVRGVSLHELELIARPIIFTEVMILNILADKKTQTRRVIKNPDWFGCLTGDCPHSMQFECDKSMCEYCPYGQPGDLLWVKETFRQEGTGFAYKVDASPDGFGLPWKSPRYMPKAASRIILEIVSTRAQRIQDISVDDIRAEGAGASLLGSERHNFAKSWDSINEKRGYPWKKNDWVWAVTFKRSDIKI